jgi:hypothetical protein
MEMNTKKTEVMRISRKPSALQITIDQKQVANAEYFNCFGSVTRNDTRRTREIKSRIATAKAALSRNKNIFTGKLDLNLMKKLVKCCIWSIDLYGAERWTHWKADQRYLKSLNVVLEKNVEAYMD